MSDERPKKSWKEIDRQREKGRSQGEPRPNSRRSQQSQKSYRAALDRLFETGKIGDLVQKQSEDSASEGSSSENRLKLLKEIKSAEGRDTITTALDRFLAHFPLPDDVDLLSKAVEHRSPPIQLEAMQKLQTLLPSSMPKRTRTLVGQLKLIRDMSGDPEMEQLARTLIAFIDG